MEVNLIFNPKIVCLVFSLQTINFSYGNEGHRGRNCMGVGLTIKVVGSHPAYGHHDITELLLKVALNITSFQLVQIFLLFSLYVLYPMLPVSLHCLFSIAPSAILFSTRPIILSTISVWNTLSGNQLTRTTVNSYHVNSYQNLQTRTIVNSYHFQLVPLKTRTNANKV